MYVISNIEISPTTAAEDKKFTIGRLMRLASLEKSDIKDKDYYSNLLLDNRLRGGVTLIDSNNTGSITVLLLPEITGTVIPIIGGLTTDIRNAKVALALMLASVWQTMQYGFVNAFFTTNSNNRYIRNTYVALGCEPCGNVTKDDMLWIINLYCAQQAILTRLNRYG